MIRRRDGSSSRNEVGGPPRSLSAIGWTLRRARTRQGLRLEEVSFRAGLPLPQLQALETGRVDHSTDRVAMLKTLRAYANFLGLPGEQLVLNMLDLWPSAPTGGAARPGHSPDIVAVPPARTAVTPTVATGRLTTAHDTGTLPATAPGVATRGGRPAGGAPATGQAAPTGGAPATGQAPPTGHLRSAWHVPRPTAQVPRVPANTGQVPVARPPRPPRAPLLLRLLVVLLSLAVLAGIAGLVIDHVRPRWLRSLGLVHTTSSTTASTATTSTPTSAPRRKTTPATTGPKQFMVGPASASGVTLYVRADTFTTDVTAVGGESWVQVIGAGSQSLYSGILDEGSSQTFADQHSLTVNIGSKAAHVFVSVSGKTVGFYLSQVAPFTIQIVGGSTGRG